MADTPDYVFTRDYTDNNRINLQHYLWVELFGYLTHPKNHVLDMIHLKSDEPLRIADVGTGTAIWLTDLSSRLPDSVQLDGLDVSFDAAPPPEWLPANVTMRAWNVKEDASPDLIGSYDIVHIRNFAFVLQDSDIPDVLSNILALLKPGGYIQWGEPDVASFRIEKTRPTNKTDALVQLLKLSQAQDNRLAPTWVPNLPTIFEKAGLENVQADVRDAPTHLALLMYECNLPIHELIAKKMRNEEAVKALKNVMPEVGLETRGGACWAFTRWTVIGKKRQ